MSPEKSTSTFTIATYKIYNKKKDYINPWKLNFTSSWSYAINKWTSQLYTFKFGFGENWSSVVWTVRKQSSPGGFLAYKSLKPILFSRQA